MCGLLLGQDSGSVERAWKLAANGQRDQAVVLLEQVIGAKPQDADARLLLGSLLMEAGKTPDAIDELTQAVKLRPRSAEAQNALGEAYLSYGNFNAAREPFERAVDIKPDFGVAQMNLGEALLGAGALKDASERFDRAIHLLPAGEDAANARYFRAKIYLSQGDAAKAVEALQSAVVMRPAFPQAWSDLGEARKNLLDDAGALAAFQHAVDLAPDDGVAQYRLGAAYLDADRTQLALVHLEAAYQINPADQSTLNALQRALRLAGRNEEADKIKARLTELLRQKDEQNQKAQAAADLNNEGARLQKAGDLQGALKKYRAAAELASNNLPIRVNYAIALLRTGEWTAGLNELHDALMLDPGNAKIQEALKEAIAQAPPRSVPDWGRQ